MPPIVWLDEHYEALEVWRIDAKGGRLPAGTTLVHLDAHPDMGVPEAGETELTVSNFIVPAITEGIFREMIWVPPHWLKADDAGGLVNRPAGTPPYFTFWIADVPGVPGPVALDIDLDYFVCENPHEGHVDRQISKAEYEALLSSRRIRMQGTSDEETGFRTESAVLARKGSRFEWPVRVDRITDLKWGGVTYVRGCVCMGAYAGDFPVYRPSGEAWRRAVRMVGDALKKKAMRPVLITVSRSRSSGFVPKEVVGPLEEAVDAMLREVYGN